MDATLAQLVRLTHADINAWARTLANDLARIIRAWDPAVVSKAEVMRRLDLVLDRAYGSTQDEAFTSDLYLLMLRTTDRAAAPPFEVLATRLESEVERETPGTWPLMLVIMQMRLATDPLARAITYATRPSYDMARIRYFRRGRLDPNRRWVQGTGTIYRLSDRVWKQGQRTRAAIDQVISEGIRNGDDVAAIARRLERFVAPGQDGRSARLARALAQTEVSRVYHEAERQAAAIAPDVLGLRWRLSVTHPRRDICDRYAEQDGYELGAGGYPPAEVPEIPHPLCQCDREPIYRPNVDVAGVLRRRYLS